MKSSLKIRTTDEFHSVVYSSDCPYVDGEFSLADIRRAINDAEQALEFPCPSMNRGIPVVIRKTPWPPLIQGHDGPVVDPEMFAVIPQGDIVGYGTKVNIENGREQVEFFLFNDSGRQKELNKIMEAAMKSGHTFYIKPMIVKEQIGGSSRFELKCFNLFFPDYGK